MSCITMTGRRRVVDNDCKDDALKYSSPVWSLSKAKRLENMALSPEAALRAVAANHPKTRAGVLWGLLQDEDVAVRRAAVKNPRIDARMLRLASQDVDPGIATYAKILAAEISS